MAWWGWFIWRRRTLAFSSRGPTSVRGIMDALGVLNFSVANERSGNLDVVNSSEAGGQLLQDGEHAMIGVNTMSASPSNGGTVRRQHVKITARYRRRLARSQYLQSSPASDR